MIDRLNRFFGRKADQMLSPATLTQATVLGGQFVMMEDDPKKYIEDGLVYNPDLAAIVNYIEKVALRVPWVVRQGDDVIDNHEIYDIWDRGNSISRGKHVRGTWMKHYLAAGNGFLLGVAPEGGINAGKFKELWNLPYDMTIEKGRDGEILNYINRANNRKIPAEQVIHWKTSSPEGDGYFGTSPLKAGRLVLQQSNDSYLANAKTLQNLGVRGLLTREQLDQAGPEKARQLSADIQRMIGGAENFGKIPIAGGKYNYINFAVSPIDLQLLDAQLRSRQAICNIYGFPSELLNDKESSTYNNMLMIMKRLYTDVIIPLLEDMADVLSYSWVDKWGVEFRPDWSMIEALQDNKIEQAQWLNTAWWISAERKSEIMGEEPSVFGNYIPMNLIPDMEEVNIDEALKAYGLEKDRKKQDEVL
jgi:HK97 family phage portal protein